MCKIIMFVCFFINKIIFKVQYKHEVLWRQHSLALKEVWRGREDSMYCYDINNPLFILVPENLRDQCRGGVMGCDDVHYASTPSKVEEDMLELLWQQPLLGGGRYNPSKFVVIPIGSH